MKGIEKLQNNLKALRDKIATKITKAAVDQSNTVVAQSIKPLIPVLSGLLRKSLGKKSKVYRKTTVIGLVGPRSDAGKLVNHNGTLVYEDPNRISHLIEFGDHETPAVSPIRRGLAAAKQRVAAIMQSMISRGIQEEVK